MGVPKAKSKLMSVPLDKLMDIPKVKTSLCLS